MVKLVSWDVDGTLFSYTRLLGALIRLSPRKLGRMGLVATGQEIREAWRFHRLVESQRRTGDSAVVAQELERFASVRVSEREALEAALSIVRPSAHVLELLDRFRNAGVTQVALSDFECDYKLKALGISRYFAAKYSCHQLGFWKPSPIALKRVQMDFEIRPGEHLHIGDRLDADGEACVRNGCHFMLIGWLNRPVGAVYDRALLLESRKYARS